MEPKLKRGYRVEILRRNNPNIIQYLGVGCEAIVLSHRTNSYGEPVLNRNDGQIIYELFVMFTGNNEPMKLSWYKENFLELICSNEEKGEKILKEYGY